MDTTFSEGTGRYFDIDIIYDDIHYIMVRTRENMFFLIYCNNNSGSWSKVMIGYGTRDVCKSRIHDRRDYRDFRLGAISISKRSILSKYL